MERKGVSYRIEIESDSMRKILAARELSQRRILKNVALTKTWC
jgi:hypothetical protein